ncbi:putative wall-associated receptor kinase-like 16 isoform X2 [Macadamia integrifolia]|uniref:putative wall-associated receptor kinase-like 16 isoform X2 n=1 Tax=Macadamia integrifolia TaxID=60698 RepID=UPI001C52CAE1|nr:putative wall-associated receptor kinase-like 16 isoform X2 [Macadamia integrifolia]
MVPLDLVLLVFPLFFLLLWPAAAVTSSTFPIAKPGCSDKCGNIAVPYPFGFGAKECYKDESFRVTCDISYKPPRLFTSWDFEVLNISWQGEMRVLANVTYSCHNKLGFYPFVKMPTDSLMFSETENKFTVVGCDAMASIHGSNGQWHFTGGSCSTSCTNPSDMINGSCAENGCCQTSIPKGMSEYSIAISRIGSVGNINRTDDFNPCSYAFIVDKNCVCGVSKNSVGYSCNCSQGYQGNPYLSRGCQDINECADSPCISTSVCTNLPGTYKCSCPTGHYGDGKKDGSGCIIKASYRVIQVAVGTILGCLFLLIGILLVLWALRKRKDNKLKQKFFQQNGGFLLKQQLSSREGCIEAVKIFTAKELKQATNNYAQSQILGRGGNGTVYKGILPNHRTVAIKKSRKVDESQVEQFINEVVILSQINHRNIVKLLGCCLETEVPTLVYEFVTNKTLFHHIHSEGCNSPISWDNRIRIAAEIAEALTYLHSAASPPIIHRDIKSANILLDDNYTAKVSDFGASKLVPLDYTQISTLVQGTLGYLDPEYLRSSQLTEKSDVYSFGVVLAELLTGKKAVYYGGLDGETNLAMHFVTSVKEDRVWDILDDQIMTTGGKEKLQVVLKLAERCLRLKREERPTMKEVAMELQGLRRNQSHPWVAQKSNEVECLLVEPLDLNSRNIVEYNSMTNEALLSLDGGR